MARHWVRWTQADIEEVKNMANKHSLTEIARALNRSASSVQTRACELGISL
jgi:IS30 family transposase